jgi:hypothetical protein
MQLARRPRSLRPPASRPAMVPQRTGPAEPRLAAWRANRAGQAVFPCPATEEDQPAEAVWALALTGYGCYCGSGRRLHASPSRRRRRRCARPDSPFGED